MADLTAQLGPFGTCQATDTSPKRTFARSGGTLAGSRAIRLFRAAATRHGTHDGGFSPGQLARD